MNTSKKQETEKIVAEMQKSIDEANKALKSKDPSKIKKAFVLFVNILKESLAVILMILAGVAGYSHYPQAILVSYLAIGWALFRSIYVLDSIWFHVKYFPMYLVLWTVSTINKTTHLAVSTVCKTTYKIIIPSKKQMIKEEKEHIEVVNSIKKSPKK